MEDSLRDLSREATTRCDVCNSEAITANAPKVGADVYWIEVECGSCGARYSVHKKTGHVSYGEEAQLAARAFNRMKRIGPRGEYRK